MTEQSTTILMISDPVCPWCMIGYYRLRKAAENTKKDILIRFLPFELNPHMPNEGMARSDYVQQKFGDHGADFYANIRAQAMADGLEMHFDRIAHMPSTAALHCLVLWLEENHVDHTAIFMEALFCGFFQEGANIVNPNFLREILSPLPVDVDAALAVMQDADYHRRVRKHRKEFAHLGVSGVPFYIVNNQQALPGAISTQAWESIL